MLEDNINYICNSHCHGFQSDVYFEYLNLEQVLGAFIKILFFLPFTKKEKFTLCLQ